MAANPSNEGGPPRQPAGCSAVSAVFLALALLVVIAAASGGAAAGGGWGLAAGLILGLVLALPAATLALVALVFGTFKLVEWTNPYPPTAVQAPPARLGLLRARAFLLGLALVALATAAGLAMLHAAATPSERREALALTILCPLGAIMLLAPRWALPRAPADGVPRPPG